MRNAAKFRAETAHDARSPQQRCVKRRRVDVLLTERSGSPRPPDFEPGISWRRSKRHVHALLPMKAVAPRARRRIDLPGLCTVRMVRCAMHTRISRRTLLAVAGSLALPRRAHAAEVPKSFDHVQLACNDLDKGIAFVEKKTGVKAAFGGVHPGRGSRNALLKLGERRYLEILAPDPTQDRSADVRGLYKIESPRLLEWVAHVDDLAPIIRALEAAHIETKPIFPGSRKRPDGKVLRWRALNLKDTRGGVLPFFIEWSADSAHPATDAPSGCALTSFSAIDPDPESLRATFGLLQLGDVQVEKGLQRALKAVIKGPKGTLDL
jgi:catechol 2,3-dioxygenase-like lactoylglutathione lyase family enzyme